MAICTSCGGEVSERADFCRHCSAPQRADAGYHPVAANKGAEGEPKTTKIFGAEVKVPKLPNMENVKLPSLRGRGKKQDAPPTTAMSMEDDDPFSAASDPTDDPFAASPPQASQNGPAGAASPPAPTAPSARPSPQAPAGRPQAPQAPQAPAARPSPVAPAPSSPQVVSAPIATAPMSMPGIAAPPSTPSTWARRTDETDDLGEDAPPAPSAAPAAAAAPPPPAASAAPPQQEEIVEEAPPAEEPARPRPQAPGARRRPQAPGARDWTSDQTAQQPAAAQPSASARAQRAPQAPPPPPPPQPQFDDPDDPFAGPPGPPPAQQAAPAAPAPAPRPAPAQRPAARQGSPGVARPPVRVTPPGGQIAAIRVIEVPDPPASVTFRLIAVSAVIGLCMGAATILYLQLTGFFEPGSGRDQGPLGAALTGRVLIGGVLIFSLVLGIVLGAIYGMHTARTIANKAEARLAGALSGAFGHMALIFGVGVVIVGGMSLLAPKATVGADPIAPTTPEELADCRERFGDDASLCRSAEQNNDYDVPLNDILRVMAGMIPAGLTGAITASITAIRNRG